MSDIFKYINLHKKLTSKKNAITEGILDAIDNNAISIGDPLPSVNKFILTLGVARMTVVKALNVLKERGIIVSEDKVGHFIKAMDVKRELKVFLCLNTFSMFQEILYNQIIKLLSDKEIVIDLYFHHCNPNVLNILLLENMGSYGLYVISGMEDKQIKSALSRIPPKKLLQISRPPLLEEVSSISQDFYSGVKHSLGKLKTQLFKYNKFILVFPEKIGNPDIIKTAFNEFCDENGIVHQIENEVNDEQIKKGTAFWVIEDTDLISLIEKGDEMGLLIGQDMGILSYNETPIKAYIRSGITVISIDVEGMGKSIANFISNPQPTKEVFMPDVIIRKSL